MSKLKINQKGFTIIELLIASAVFSVVVLGATAMIIQMSRLYYKGIIVSRTQTATRDLIESISRPIQYESKSVAVMDRDGLYVLCVGSERYTFKIGAQQGSGMHAAWKDTVATSNDCQNGPDVDLSNPATSGRDMLSDNMRIQNIEVAEVLPGAPGLWNIKVTVIYGDDDLIDTATGLCKGQIAGSQWCSRVTYETKVFKRIKQG